MSHPGDLNPSRNSRSFCCLPLKEPAPSSWVESRSSLLIRSQMLEQLYRSEAKVPSTQLGRHSSWAGALSKIEALHRQELSKVSHDLPIVPLLCSPIGLPSGRPIDLNEQIQNPVMELLAPGQELFSSQVELRGGQPASAGGCSMRSTRAAALSA